MASCKQKFINLICCRKKSLFPDPYEFDINTADMPPQNKLLFESNFVRTSKYSAFSFLPKSLLAQFRRIANVYFLLIAILLSIDIISPLNPLTAWAPLIIVIGISMIREGYEDFQRYKSDKQLNYKSFSRVIRNGQQTEMTWSNVLVGDICLVKEEETFPADLILLSSSSETGAAFIQTGSLDGEKNLKPRNAFRDTLGIQSTQSKHLKGRFSGELPSKQLHKFSAKFEVNGKNMVIQGDKQLLYRGTKLKNTEYIYGLVIYTGKNTKIMMNSDSESSKMSQVQTKVNYILGIILLVQIIFCIVAAIAHGIFRNKNIDSYYYVDWNSDNNTIVDSVIIFFTYFVLINTMIPISLIVSIEMVKLFQKYFIDEDKFMFSQWRKIGVNVKSASLNEELGQIQYVFSDKTGTLTKNLMQFKIATINQQMYGDLALVTPKGQYQPQGNLPGFHDQGLKELLRNRKLDKQIPTPIIIKNSQGQQKLKLKTQREVAEQFFVALSTAHQVVADKKSGKTKYQGPSPDQITLVQAAKDMNYQFLTSTQSTTTVKIMGKDVTYQILQLFPFTSQRKRMSIILKDKETGLIKMYSKGADIIIKERLAADNKLNLDDELTRFSVIGLRTLLIAMRVVSDKQYSQFAKAVDALPSVDREKPLNELQSKIEKNLYLIGATAVLDRLQDQVPETIRDLIRANINVWMLTGDKLQTAQNIAKSCNLIQPNFNVLRFKPPANSNNYKSNLNDPKQNKQKQKNKQKRERGSSEATSENQFLKSGDQMGMYMADLVTESRELSQAGLPKALLIEGSDLTRVLQKEEYQKQLALLAENCEAVVACRLQPLQKAEVVTVVRKYLGKITLSIGDGANDIPMIKAAHIGIGLYGQEGMGAVQASDYALPQFRMLWRLLLVHGRWNYIRISQMILYFFYKNMLFTIPQWIAAFFVGYSGQTIYDDAYVTLYNLIFTALPLLLRAVLEQDVNYVFQKKEAYEEFPAVTGKSMISQNQQLPERYTVNKYFFRLFPKIYFIGQQNCIFNYKNYFAWLAEGMIEAVIITIVVFFVLSETSVNGDGISSDFWLAGITIYSTVILVVTFKLATHTRFWSYIYLGSILFTSLGLYIIYMWISNYVFSDNVEGVAFIAWTSFQTYLVVLLGVCMVLFIDGLVVFVDFKNGSYASKMRQIVYQQQINNRQFYDQASVSITSGLTGSEADDVNRNKQVRL